MGRHSPARMPRVGTLSRRLRAILAGGLVLGVGAAVTLAAWTDQETASGSFNASVFNTESSVDRVTWAHNTNPPVATLTAGTGMSPTVSVFSAFNIRTTAATTVDGNVLLNATTTTGVLGGALEYRIARADTVTTTCNAAAMTGGTFVTDATDAGTWTNAGTLATGAINWPIGAAGSELRYCIEVRIKVGSDNSFQGTSGTLTWTFTSTSTS